MSVDAALLGAVTGRLATAGCVAAADEAAAILAAAPDRATVGAWVTRRERGEPLAWIVEHVRFCGGVVHVTPGVYVPRVQTEDLARRAVALLPRHGVALDLCTGAGAIAAHLTRRIPTALVIGLDIDASAARCTARNGVMAVVADLAEPIRAERYVDVVTAVAPYVPTDAIGVLPADVRRFEPRVALDGGADGLDVIRRVVAAAGRLLRPGGWLLLEVGGSQDRELAPALAAHGFGLVEAWDDEDGDLRGIAARIG